MDSRLNSLVFEIVIIALTQIFVPFQISSGLCGAVD